MRKTRVSPSRGPATRRRRSGLAALAAAAIAGSVLGAPVLTSPAAGVDGVGPAAVSYWRGVNPVTALTASSFSAPPATDRPWVRWNWIPASTSIGELQRELDELAAAGVAGVEIGQGGNPTNEQLQAVLTKANQVGITVGLKYSGGAPTAANWSNTNDYNRKTLNQAPAYVNAGETLNGPLPAAAGASTAKDTIVGVLAYRCSTNPCVSGGKANLERSSAVNLTATLTGTNQAGYLGGTTTGNLNWTAPASPAGAQWVVVTFRAIPLGVTPEVLSTQGTDALIAGYEQLWTPEIKALLEQNRSDIFVDSHISDPWGVATDLWSSNISADFAAQTGYALAPNLAALFQSNYSFSDNSDQRVRTDFFQVRNDLFIKNRLTRFTDWAHTHGMTLRLQNEDPVVGGAEPPYQDVIDTSLALERPEHESLSGADQIDIYRPVSSANHWNGNPWMSTECCAVAGQAYVETMQDVIARMNKEFAGGITKLVYHVYPGNSDAPTATFPGYSNFGPTSFSGSWGPRNPNWASDAPAVNAYMARSQQVLTQGKADTDIGVYLHSFEFPNLTNVNTDGSYFGNRQWDDLALQRAGWSWDYVNPTMVRSSQAKVSGGQLNAAGPSYKAMVIDSGINTPLHPLKTAMPLDVARKMLEFSQDGLPIILVGDLPSSTPGDTPGRDAELRGVITDLVAQPNVHRVASEAGVPAKLTSLGLQPDVEPAERTGLVNLHRSDAATSTDYYYLYNEGFNQTDTNASRSVLYEEPSACRYTGAASNPCRMTGDAIDQEVTLRGNGAPYLLDAASGKITPITDYTTGPGTVTVRVALGVDQATIIALSSQPGRFGVIAPAVHVESTTADEAEIVGDQVVLRDTTPGVYTATLSNGRTVTGTVTQSPAPSNLTKATWDLKAEDWVNADPISTTGAASSAIQKKPVAVTLNGLKVWPDIPELANASGVGTYTTTVDVGQDWTPGGRAELSLGQVVDTVAITVNGQAVPVDQLKATADIGPALRAGVNTVQVRVSTTLNNRLATLYPAVATRGVTQNYGLLGPVTVTPYGQVSVPVDAASTPTGPATPPAAAATKLKVKVKPAQVRASGPRPTVTVRVTSAAGTPAGAVTVKVRGLDKTTTTTLKAGRATVRLPKLTEAGTYKVVATYLGSNGFAVSKKVTTIRVRR